MIKFRPKMESPNEEIKAECSFETMEEMLQYVFDSWSRVVAYMGGKEPFRMDEIVIDDMIGENPQTGWKEERMILVKRMRDKTYLVPMCIGYCGG